MATEAKGEVKVVQFLTPRRASLNRRHTLESTSIIITPPAEEEVHINSSEFFIVCRASGKHHIAPAASVLYHPLLLRALCLSVVAADPDGAIDSKSSQTGVRAAICR